MYSVIMTMLAGREERYGDRPVETSHADEVSDFAPQQSPPLATGGPCGARGRPGNATGHRPQQKPLIVLLWNTDCISNKEVELEQVLHSKDVSVYCIQETHLKKDRSFKVLGYQCFRIVDETDLKTVCLRSCRITPTLAR